MSAPRFCLPLVALLFAALIIPAFGAAAAENPYPAGWFWGDAQQRKVHDAMIGKRIPRMRLSDWVNGPVTSRDLEGKIVVLDYWATWCGPCIKSIPHNNELAAKYADQGVVVLGICGSSRGQEKMEQVAEQHDIQYPCGKDRSRNVERALNVMWYPTYAVVDRQGRYRAVGLMPSHIEAVVQDLLQEQPGPDAVDEQGNADPADAEKVALDYEPLPAAMLEGTDHQRERFAGLEGQRPPAMQLENWLNAAPPTAKDLKGKVVLIDFWATWCGPCIQSIPKTNELMDKYGPEGLVILGVCQSRGAENMAATVKRHDIRYPVAADIDHATEAAYIVNGFPDYYLVDRSGVLRAADVKNGQVEEAIKLLLAEPAPGEEDDDAVARAD